MDNYNELKESLNLMLMQCDGTVTTDEMGFNRYDAPFARDLARRPEWSPRQAQAVHKMLRKYKTQLEHHGVNFDAIPIPSLKDAPARASRNDIRKASLNEDRIILSFRLSSRSEFESELAEIRAIPGRQYHENLKAWSVPINNYSIDKIDSMSYEIDPAILKWKEENDKPKAKLDIPQNVKLYPFQEEGVQMLEQLNGRALLSDEQGCGKTCQVICWMKSHPELRPAIIIVPASLKINWTREFKKWGCDEKITVINGTSFPMSMNEKLVVVNYDVIGSYIEIFEEMKFKLMVCDESHAIKNSKANRTRAVKYLAKDIPHIICISGTPIINRPIEFYTTLNLLMPKMFNSKNRFIEEYCGGFAEGGKGASNTIRLNEILSKSFMIRRLKKDVLKELPDKQISIVPMEISNRKVYKRAEEDFINWLAETEGDEKAMRAMTAETLVRMEKLKQLSVEGKMEQVIEWIQDIFDQDEKLVVFCTHHSAIDKLMETFKDVAVKLDGRTTQADRQKAVDAFQEDEKVRLFIGNIKAAGTGITLTAASIAAFVEIAWTPGEHDQAMDRIHRIGQEESCNIYYLVGMDTIEDDMALLLDSKRQVLTAILNGEAPEDQSLVWELIQKYKEKGR